MKIKDYTVYCHTNKINGKKYVGITGYKPEERWCNGKRHMSKGLSFAWYEGEVI